MTSRADVAQKYREKTAELDKLRCEVCDLIEGGFEAKAEIAIEKHRKLLNDAEFKKLKNVQFIIDSKIDETELDQRLQNYMRTMEESKRLEKDTEQVNAEVSENISRARNEGKAKLAFLTELGFQI